MFMTLQRWLGQVLKTKPLFQYKAMAAAQRTQKQLEVLAALDSGFFKTFFMSFWPYNICDIGLNNVMPNTEKCRKTVF